MSAIHVLNNNSMAADEAEGKKKLGAHKAAMSESPFGTGKKSNKLDT